jgi:competence protein ComEC
LPTFGLLAGIGAFARWPRLRPLLASAALTTLLWLAFTPGLPISSVAFLDVGQGDAAIITTRVGTILVDAGPDPRELWRALQRYRVRSLALIVATHPHDDHIGGLIGLAGRIPIGEVWHSGDHHDSQTWDQVAAELRARGIPIEVPKVGSSLQWGEVFFTVLGPERRYEDPNDESIVIAVRGQATSVLLTGDIELAAQRDLTPIDVDVLKVPHHGGGTSDIDWLLATSPEVAVISVGENHFGHPHQSVIEGLSGAGVEIERTDLEGDVVISLSSAP